MANENSNNDTLQERNDLLKEQANIQEQLKETLTDQRNLHREISRLYLTQTSRLEKALSVHRSIHSVMKRINEVGQTHVRQIENMAKTITKKINIGGVFSDFTKQLHSAVRELVEIQKVIAGTLIGQAAVQTGVVKVNGRNGNGNGFGAFTPAEIGKLAKVWDKHMYSPFERIKRWFVNLRKDLKKPIQLELAGMGGGKGGGGGIGGLLNHFFGGSFGKLVTPSNALLAILGKVLLVFRNMDKAAWSFRSAMGMTRDTSEQITTATQQMAKQFMGIGVTVEKLYDSVLAFVSSFGSLNFLTKDVQRNIAVMSAQLGVSETTSASFLKRLSGMKVTTAEAQKSMLGFVAAMSNAAGTNLSDVMKDIASASDDTLTLLRGNTLALIQGAVKARLMGSSINDMAKSAKGLLDFTSSIESEMEASVLTGRNINLQLARELAFRGDILGSNQEILRLAKEIQFNQLDPFSASAVAKAFGKSAVELQNMLQAQKEMEALEQRAKTDQTLAKRLLKYKELSKAAEGVATLEGKMYEKQLLMKANQDRLTILANKWEQVWFKITEAGFPFIDALLSALPPMVDMIHHGMRLTGVFLAISKGTGLAKAVIESMKTAVDLLSIKFAGVGKVVGKVAGWFKNLSSIATGIFSKVAGVVSKAVAPFQKVVSFVKQIGTVLKPVVSWFGKLFSPLAKALPWLGKIGLIFGKWIPVIGWVITGLQFVGSLFKRLKDVWTDDKLNFGQKILASFKAIGGALYDTLIQPFVDVWKWIKGIFVGNSPSLLGKGIVDGLTAVSGMIIDSLLNPFKFAWKWIAEQFGNLGSLFGFRSAKIPAPEISPPSATTGDTVDPLLKATQEFKTGDAPKLERSTTASQVTSGILEALASLKASVDEVNKNLLAGNVKAGDVFLDGQLLATMMNRGNVFRGTYGAMQR